MERGRDTGFEEGKIPLGIEQRNTCTTEAGWSAESYSLSLGEGCCAWSSEQQE